MQCQAKSKRSGEQCRNWAVKGKRVCRMHGAFAGIKTKEGRQRQVEAVTKSGLYSKKSMEERKQVREMLREAKAFLKQIP